MADFVQARRIRKDLLAASDALVSAKLLPAADVVKIREGTGALDTAKDCVALADLFEGHWVAIEGKTAVTKEDLADTVRLAIALKALPLTTSGKIMRWGSQKPLKINRLALSSSTNFLSF